MKRLSACLAFAALFFAFRVTAIESTASSSQREYEKSINAVVQNKLFYKSGRIEAMGTAGVMPYDSLTAHYMLGGRLNWHLSDHYGWEILDAQLAFPSVTGFTRNLVSSKNISNLQTPKIKMLAGSGFLLSPVYGKIRFFGRQVLYLDIYLVFGIGAANTEILQVSSTGQDQPPAENILKTNWDPMFDFGLGVKIFLNRAMGLVIDLRDYVISSQTYGRASLKSNFSVFGGLTFFIPTFG